MKRILLCASALALATQAHAGGRLDTIKFTGESNTLPGLEDVEVVGIFWDERCADVEYTLDTITTTDQNGDEIPIEVIEEEMKKSFNQWNRIKTSYIRMRVTDTRTIGNGTRSFDFINELTFEVPAGSGFLASSPSTSLQEDATFSVGDDIDEDGDSDVFDPAVEGRNTCFDADGDGDIEFPAGDYLAGTILDNDVQFNGLLPGQGLPWSVKPLSSPPGGVRSTDIRAVAVHEFGHSHGLAHSMVNQVSDTNGRGSTMFPFIDIDDKQAEKNQRKVWEDDIAWSSFLYPEGSSNSGIAKRTGKDRSFTGVYAVIEGEVTRNGVGVLGGNIAAIDTETGEILSEAYSGTAQYFFDGVDVFFFDTPPNDVASVIDGNYQLPVLKDRNYDLALQASDGDPVAGSRVSNVAFIGLEIGQQDFPEEFWSFGSSENEDEHLPGVSFAVEGENQTGVDFETNIDELLRNAGPLNFIGTSAVFGQSDVVYAERFDNADVLALLNDGASPTTGLFRTWVSDASTIPLFQRAAIAVGRVNGNGEAVIEETLRSTANFVGQQDDLTPYFFDFPAFLGSQLKERLEVDPDLDVFLVLEALNGYAPGDSATPPLLGLSVTGIDPTTSFLSVNNGPLAPRASNWTVELRFTQTD